MAITFPNYPTSGNRLPGIYADIDASQANTATGSLRALIFGQITSSGNGVTGVPVICQSVQDAKTKGGPGSMLALMVAQYRKQDPFGELWMVPLADDGSGTAATGKISYQSLATTTLAYTDTFYIAGQIVRQAYTAGMTAGQMATALAATLTAATDLPITAAVDGTNVYQVNLTAKNKGLAGNDIKVYLNYGGSRAGEVTPSSGSVPVTITQLASGATNPSLTTPLLNLADQAFEVIVMPFNDSTSLNALDATLSDATGRWSWLSMRYGVGLCAFRGTVSARTTFGTGRNDKHTCCMGFGVDAPEPYWIWAADLAGTIMPSIRIDPGVPFNTLAMSVLPETPANRDVDTDRNTMLFDGISTHKVDAAGVVRIERLISLYQTNPLGQPDDSYLNAERLFQLAQVIRLFRVFQSNQFARKKAASVGTPIPPNSNVINADTVRTAIISYYRSLQDQGLVQNADIFATKVTVEYAAGVFKELLPIDLVNQAEQFPMLVQFKSS